MAFLNLKMDEQFNNDDLCQDLQVYAQNYDASPDDTYFDEVVGALQNIMLDKEFDNIQDKFMRNYYNIFEDTQENKNEYMEIFNLYQKEIEYFVEQSLKKQVENFDMAKFVRLLEERTNQIDEQILDMVESFSDFLAFKRIMLAYKDYIQNEETFKDLAIKSNRIS